VTSLSAISDPERLFIAEYGAIIERQSKFKVGLAIRELKRLKSEPDGLMKDAERYYNAGKNYDLAIFNYEEVLDLLRHEERSFSDPRWSEAYVHYWLGICYANTKHEDDAITQLKEAVSRDKGYAAKICNERFKTLVGPIKDKPALQELIKELQKENQKENQNEQVPDESAMEKDKPGPKKPIVDLRLLRAFEQIEKETIKDH
jgi:tetratricopeptide (TPR) repeat protein